MVQQLGASEQTFNRWRNQYGGLKVDQTRRFQEQEQENARLRRLVSDAEPDKAILKEEDRGHF